MSWATTETSREEPSPGLVARGFSPGSYISSSILNWLLNKLFGDVDYITRAQRERLAFPMGSTVPHVYLDPATQFVSDAQPDLSGATSSTSTLLQRVYLQGKDGLGVSDPTTFGFAVNTPRIHPGGTVSGVELQVDESGTGDPATYQVVVTLSDGSGRYTKWSTGGFVAAASGKVTLSLASAPPSDVSLTETTELDDMVGISVTVTANTFGQRLSTIKDLVVEFS